MDELGLALHNGERWASEAISVLDPMVTRGDGCFEAVRTYGGAMVGLDAHLARLDRSAKKMAIALPPLASIREWVVDVAGDRGDGVVRVFVSADGDASNVYVFSTSLPNLPTTQRLLPVAAPWHPGGMQWELAGVKTLSYAANVSATRVANQAGFDDALLVSREGIILEAPTAAVLWVVDGVIEIAELDLGILESVTAAMALETARSEGLEVRDGRFPLDRFARASEVAIMSTTREIVPVVAVGDREFPAGPVTGMLADSYRAAMVSG